MPVLLPEPARPRPGPAPRPAPGRPGPGPSGRGLPPESRAPFLGLREYLSHAPLDLGEQAPDARLLLDEVVDRGMERQAVSRLLVRTGACGGYGGGCWCDSYCTGYGDCCGDFVRDCPAIAAMSKKPVGKKVRDSDRHARYNYLDLSP